MCGNIEKSEGIFYISMKNKRCAEVFQVSIVDSGTGLSPDFDYDMVSQNKFAQCDTMSDCPNRGLGLPIASRLAELHGGGLVLMPRKNRLSGTIFSVALPVNVACADENIEIGDSPTQRDYPATPFGKPPSSSAIRKPQEHTPNQPLDAFDVLVQNDDKTFADLSVVALDDDPMIVLLLKRLLSSAKKCDVYTNSQDVFSHLGECRTNSEPFPDVILLDIVLNDENGIEVLRALRNAGFNMPAIAVTGNSSPTDIASYYSAGFSSVVAKPYTKSMLQSKIVKVANDHMNGYSPRPTPLGNNPCDLYCQ